MFGTGPKQQTGQHLENELVSLTAMRLRHISIPLCTPLDCTIGMIGVGRVVDISSLVMKEGSVRSKVNNSRQSHAVHHNYSSHVSKYMTHLSSYVVTPDQKLD